MNTPRRRRTRVVSGVFTTALAAGSAMIALPGGTGSPVSAMGALQEIDLETPGSGEVILGSLASRSQRGDVTIAGIGPYTMTGTDALSGDPYNFVTDAEYFAPVDGGRDAYTRESTYRGTSSALTTSFDGAASYDGRTDILELTSNGFCNGPNTEGGDGEAYCSVFGPEVYSEPFDASVGQSVTFDWGASADEDDYEIYAYLVAVEETAPGSGTFDYGNPSSHTLLTYGRGEDQTWITASGEIPDDGTYRFRFANGTYDGTGGQAVGSVMYIDDIVRVGLSNPIAFAQPSDQIFDDGDFTLTATATSPGGGPVTFQSLDTSVCTVSGSTVTPVSVGTCSIIADHPGDGVDYVPAPSVFRNLQVLAAPTAPVNSGEPLIQGGSGDGDVVTATEGTWNNGGSPVTGTTGVWQSNGTAIPGVTGESCVLVEDPTSTLTYEVTKTNSVGSTSEDSAELVGFTCAAALAPTWTDDVLGDLIEGVAVTDGVLASGSPAPTYSVTAGSLPAGLSLDGDTGAITGTPTASGPYDFTVTADNGVGDPITVQFTGDVEAPAAPVWTDDELGSLKVGTELADGVLASGSPAPTYSVTAGSLPAGLSLDGDTGAITGTPTASGPYDFTVTADNGVGDAITTRFEGSVAPEEPATDPEVEVEPPADEDSPIVVTGTGFKPGSPVDILIDGVVVTTTTADDEGNISVEVAPPADVPSYEVTVRGPNGDDVEVDNDLRVVERFDGETVTLSADAGYMPVDPQRLLDTRTGDKVAAGETLRLAVSADWGLPASATAVAINVAAAQPNGTGFLTVHGCESDLPLASSVNYQAGSNASNLVIAELDESNEICIYSFDGAHLVVDLNGYFADDVANRLSTDDPIRLLDTRAGDKIGAGETVEIQVTGEELAPVGSMAAVLNVAAPQAEGLGFLTLFPCGEEMPLASNVNYVDGKIASNLSFSKLNDTGSVCLFSSETTHVVVDLNGAFGADQAPHLVPNVPVRVLDTRSGDKVEAGETVRIELGGENGIDDAAAFALNVTSAQADESGFATLYSCDIDRPIASNLNFTAGLTGANHVTVAPDADGTVCLFVSATTHLVVDVQGVYL